MPGNFSILYTEAPGNTILSSRWNAQINDIINKFEPQYMDDYSTNVATMRTTEDPGESGSESLPSSLQGELTRIRFAILDAKQAIDSSLTYWYETPTTNTAITGPSTSVDNTVPRFNGTGGDILQNSNVTISDLDVVDIGTTDIVTSSSSTTFSSTTVVDGTAWDLSEVLVGDYAVASGGSYGLINTVNDGTNTLTVDSWVGGTPSNGETVTVERRGSLQVDNKVTIGDGTGVDTNPDLTINKNTGDARLRLQVGNSSSTAWDIAVDNDDSDALDLDFNGTEGFKFRNSAPNDVIVFDTDVPSAATTPEGCTLHPANIVQARGKGSRAIGGTTTAGAMNEAYNCAQATADDVNSIRVDFLRPMATGNYTILFTIHSATGGNSGHFEVTDQTTDGFNVRLRDETGATLGTSTVVFSFAVIGQMS